MLNFAQYILTEAKKPSSAKSAAVSSDDKGKLHELLLAKHLHPENKLPSHWRSASEDYGGTPKQVHARLKAKIPPAAYKEINSHAKQTATAVKAHFEQVGHTGKVSGHAVRDVHWTSNRDAEHNPGDHERTTGIKDKNSNADLIVTTVHKKTGDKKFVGISAKYGSESKPNLKNSGLDTLEKEAGHKKGAYSSLLHAHNKTAEGLGYSGSRKQRHQQYKSDIAEREEYKKKNKTLAGFKPSSQSTSKALNRATEAEKSSLETRKTMASMHREAFSVKTDPELRKIIKNNASPKTVIPHIVAHSHVQNDATAVPKIHSAESHAENHLAKFKNLRVEKAGSGISVNIKGDHISSKKTGVNVATQTFKAGSGPHKGIAGAFKLG